MLPPREDTSVKEAIVSLKKSYRSLRTITETATGVPCIRMRMVLSSPGNPSSCVARNARQGRRIIRKRLNLAACNKEVYFLP